MTEMLAYTIAGIVLYFASDWILVQLEQARGGHFENRTIIFFGIILVLAVTSFAVIRIFVTQ